MAKTQERCPTCKRPWDVYWEIPRKSHSGISYKIQKRREAGVVMQRHIWYPPSEGVETKRVDEWIRSVQSIAPHFKEMHGDPDETT